MEQSCVPQTLHIWQVKAGLAGARQLPAGVAHRRYLARMVLGLAGPRLLSDLVAIMNTLEIRRIALEPLSDRTDASSASGKLIFLVFANMAEFERNLIRERTHAGIATVRARGCKGGRTPSLNHNQVKQIKALLKDPDIKVMDLAKTAAERKRNTKQAVCR